MYHTNINMCNMYYTSNIHACKMYNTPNIENRHRMKIIYCFDFYWSGPLNYDSSAHMYMQVSVCLKGVCGGGVSVCVGGGVSVCVCGVGGVGVSVCACMSAYYIQLT